MWLTDVMMLLFGAAMLCVLFDLLRSYTNAWRVYLAGAISILALGISLIDLLVNWTGGVTGTIPIRPTDSNFASLYIVDKFSIFVIFAVLSVGIAVVFYSIKSLDANANVGPFYALVLILLLSLIGVASAGDLLTLFLFWEGMSVAAYGLVAFSKRVTVSLEAALKYLFLAGSGSLIALFGIALVYSLTGSILLGDLGYLFQSDPQLGTLALAMLLAGLGVEAAIFPLHTWLPDAYSAAPTPVSAILAGVVTETAVFALIKIVSPSLIIPVTTLMAIAETSFSSQPVQFALVIVAVLTMLIGNLGALGQSNIKRILSYSSIAHVGYMLAALATFSVVGVVAIVFHIWNHGLVKSSFFMLTGQNGGHYEDAELAHVKGLFGKNRLLGGLFALSSVGMAGVPPFGTFWSELLIIQSLFATGSPTFYVLAIIVVLNIALSVGYFSKIITGVAEDAHGKEKVQTNWSLSLSPLLLILLSLLTGFIPWLFLARLT